MTTNKQWEELLKMCGVIIEYQNTGYEHYPIHRFSENESWKAGLPPPTLDNIFSIVIQNYTKEHGLGATLQLLNTWINCYLLSETPDKMNNPTESLIETCYEFRKTEN